MKGAYFIYAHIPLSRWFYHGHALASCKDYGGMQLLASAVRVQYRFALACCCMQGQHVQEWAWQVVPGLGRAVAALPHVRLLVVHLGLD